MTLSVTYRGVDITSILDLDDELPLTTVADGSTGMTEGVTADDPSGSVSMLPLGELVVEESACANPRCFTGTGLNFRIGRGTNWVGAGREWTFDVPDLNELLKRRKLRGADADRAAETGSARIAWLLTTVGMAGVVHDNGAIAANAWTYEKTDFRGKYALDVLESIVSASGELGRVFFVYWDHAAGEPSLFYASPNAAINDSTLRISNVASDVDGTTTFAPYDGSELEAKGEAIYDGVYVTGAGGLTLYRQRASTFATYGVHVDGELTWDRISNATYAATHAETFLDRHSGQIDTIKVTVRLPKAKVNLIDAGMRISVRFQHLPGFTSFTWTRVTRRTLILTKGLRDEYDVQLELSVRGLDQSGGGSPGGTPAPSSDCSPTPSQAVVREDLTSSGTQVTIAAPNPGDLLIAYIFGRGTITGANGCTDDSLIDPSGWTEHPNSPLTPAGGSSVILRAYEKVASGDETLITILSGGNGNKCQATVFVVPQATIAERITATAGGAGPPQPFSSGNLSASRKLLIDGTVFNADDISHDYAGTVTGATEVDDGTIDNNFSPGLWIGYDTDVTSLGGTWNHNNGNASLAYGIDCDTEASPPMEGQWTDWLVIAEGDGTTTSFTFPFPYADRSLEVKVDAVPIIAGLTEVDAIAGTFSLDFAPKAASGDTRAEIVYARAQGR